MNKLAWILICLSHFLISALGAISCSGDDANEVPVDTGSDTVIPDSGISTDTESETMDTDTGESDIPPVLPELCTADRLEIELSGSGDGRSPTIAQTDNAIVAYAYDTQENPTNKSWQIRTRELSADGTISNPNEPVGSGGVSVAPSFATQNGEFLGLAWLDNRWDSTCDTSDLENCVREVAFMALDKTGTALNSLPTRVSTSAGITQSPVITATPNGWLVAWIQTGESSGNGDVMIAAIAADGTAGLPIKISEDERADNNNKIEIATTATTAAVVWASRTQKAIWGRIINLDGTIRGDLINLDATNHIYSPSVASSKDFFLFAWSRKPYNDHDIYTQLTTAEGETIGELNRASWTTSDVTSVKIKRNETTDQYALVWHSSKNNGDDDCIFDSCSNQVMLTLLNNLGIPTAASVIVSNNPNTSKRGDAIFFNDHWLVVWEHNQHLRSEIVYGKVNCAK